MKKFFYLLFISAFALTGCSKEISPNDAEKVAADIKNYRTNINAISELKVKCKSSLHYNGTSNRELINEKEESSILYELSSRFYYIHISTSSNGEDKVEKSSDPIEKEQWIYMKKRVLYKAYRTKSKGSETKTYSKVEKYSDAIKEFSSLFDTLMPSAYELARGTEFLDVKNIEDFLDENYAKGMNYTAKFYSSGAGNLRVVGAASLAKNEAIEGEASGVGTISCKWNKYLLSSANFALQVNTSDGTNKNNMKFTAAISEKVSSLVIPSYPKLSNFAESSSMFQISL